MSLRLRDTRTGSLRTVSPGRPGPLALYVCGPTVYDAAHVGHGRTYLYFDLLRRTLEEGGTTVRHIMNITDFEDKVDVRAAELGLTWKQLARQEERRFLSDLRQFGARMPHSTPRASDFVTHMVEVARRLDRTGRIHRQGDSWFYTPPTHSRWRNFPIAGDLEQHAVPEPGHPLTEA
ncbi:cysteinyl-tRNA synthetase, partial [mine drainage metagenome]